jgi:hypothetical protein
MFTKFQLEKTDATYLYSKAFPMQNFCPKLPDFEKKKTSKFARFLQEVPVASQECKRMPANPHFYFHLWFIVKFG